MLAPSAISWFEIPAADLERSIRFYETLLGVKLARDAMGPVKFAVFPAAARQPTGCVIAGDGYRPNAQGTTVYLSVADDLSQPLARVEHGGGKVLLGKTALPDDMGFYAQFVDSEGNRVGLFSPK